MSSNFSFLQSEWPQIYESAVKAEQYAIPDPPTACIHARRTLELAMQWLFKSDPALKPTYQQTLSAMVNDHTLLAAASEVIVTKARIIVKWGNLAAHATGGKLTKDNSVAVVKELFHFCYWLASTYAQGAKPPAAQVFLPMLLPTTSAIPPATKTKLEELEAALSQKDAQLEELAKKLEDHAALDAELVKLRAEVAEAKKRNEQAKTGDGHDYSEAETRRLYIDVLLREAGWIITKDGHDKEFEVRGMPSGSGVGYVDYVLWGKDGKPLALVEAKRTTKDPTVGRQQAKLYADCLEKQFGQRPVIFYSNGYTHWIWDDVQYPPRQVSGFLKHDELELLIQRRTSRQKLEGQPTDGKIVERYYQERAIRKICDRLEKENQRRALLVMATGAGKTRTVIALCDVLMKAGWVKRVLFLADRVALVRQAVNAFKQHLPASSPVNLVTEKSEMGRVYVSTYPTMMRLIDEMREDGTRRFGPGHFDLVVVDEAHRSIYQRYGAIFEYFDSFLVGLTATPRDEVDHNTYKLFDLEDGVPTDEYSLDAAIKDKYLVPSKPISVPLKFLREGIKYDDLSSEEKERWESTDWGDDEDGPPDEVDANAINLWLYNKDTVDKMLKYLMEHGQKVEGGDRLGKTIIFARKHEHAEFIAKRFDENYPQYKGDFARVIDFKVDYAQSLIDSFAVANKSPHIAISVDMLDTGIDVPEVVNLVFFKPVWSKTKFWQMVGRGTRLCENLFAPGEDKKFFYIFDCCRNLEYFSQNPENAEVGAAQSLSAKLFIRRVELVAEIDGQKAAKKNEVSDPAYDALRSEVADRLRTEVAGMNPENFIVRPKLQLVEKFGKPEAWTDLNPEALAELTNEIAGLPSSSTPDGLEAKQFDLLMLRMELALLRGEPGLAKMQETLVSTAQLLEEQTAIPVVAARLPLIVEVQSQEFWEGVTVVCLERVRKGLRELVLLIEKRKRPIVYTDFDDEIGQGELITLPGISPGVNAEKFKDKAEKFLHKHENDPAIHKLRFNEPLTAEDLEALEAIFQSEGSSPEEIAAATKATDGLGLFVRSILGMDRGAAKSALSGFLNGKNLTVNQIEFLNMVVNHLAQSGWIRPALLFESPFTDIHQDGVIGVFDESSTVTLIGILNAVRQNAVGPSSAVA
jgi:type I restriction enzyme R subunit